MFEMAPLRHLRVERRTRKTCNITERYKINSFHFWLGHISYLLPLSKSSSLTRALLRVKWNKLLKWYSSYFVTRLGMSALVDGTVPPAAGMSSSSALVCASGLTAAFLNDCLLNKVKQLLVIRYKILFFWTKWQRKNTLISASLDHSSTSI